MIRPPRRFPLPLAALLGTAVLLAGTPAAFAQAKKKRDASGRVDLASELPADARQLAIGDAALDFSLKGVDGQTYSLADFKAAPVLMVVFLSNHCPYSHAAETRLLPLAREFQGRGLAVVAINPNSPQGVAITELGYSKYNDSYPEMILYAKEQGFPFPYLYDGDTQQTAKNYGCLATPHVFLFDRARRLRYVGRVDDSRFANPATVTSFDARNAVVALLADKPVPVEKTLVVGCSTKWKSNKAENAQADARWQQEPVDLALLDAAGVAALAKNDSNRLRLINVWATWCTPCVAEFPGLVALARQLGNRDFELVTLSLDDPKQQAGAKKFLERQHAAPPGRLKRLLKAEGRDAVNFLYTGASTGALAAALDPQWPGPLPHTVVIAPGGKIIYRHNGPLDFAELRAALINELGPYYK
ncbi:redoxin domain-containing protein [Opitutus sp. GAS368]|uniref:redoxin domain-containing protein n=1 Tax=Opitutus sp. GAS368 TaxID=1882749 RepID=UPI00087C53C9|nr:redoxin domain-containing protein [Opitutus sp. GAS368]SDS00901.1 Peroxiredoxin [Opitutus sp. GAS368]